MAAGDAGSAAPDACCIFCQPEWQKIQETAGVKCTQKQALTYLKSVILSLQWLRYDLRCWRLLWGAALDSLGTMCSEEPAVCRGNINSGLFSSGTGKSNANVQCGGRKRHARAASQADRGCWGQLISIQSVWLWRRRPGVRSWIWPALNEGFL